MKSFTDNSGRSWAIVINVDAIKKVRGLLSIDLAKIADDNFKLLASIVEDPVQLVDVIYCLCKEQADKEGVSDVDFGRSMSGDSIMAAADAFVEELTDFFPYARGRQAMKAVMDKGKKLRELLMDRAMLKLEGVDLAKEAESLMSLAKKTSTLKSSSGGSPGSSESTQAP